MLCTVPGSGRGQLGLSCICANFFLFFYLLYRCLTLPRSDQMWCPVWPFSLSEFRSTPCGSGSECSSCGSSHAPVSSALWPASARRSRTLLRASEFRERERVRWAQMVQSCWEGFGCLGEGDFTNCRIRMLRGDPREDFLPVGSGEMCPHLQNMVVSSELQMDKWICL